MPQNAQKALGNTEIGYTLAKAIWKLLPANKKSAAIRLWLLMIVGMGLEMIGLGLVIPVLALLTQQDAVLSHPVLQSVLVVIGNPDRRHFLIWVMLSLVVVYLLKNLFLAFLAWRQSSFIYGLQAELSQRLFAIYMAQPYTFHLQRNSAHLIRNMQGEMSMFISNAVSPCLQVMADGLLLLGLFGLLVYVEPIGTLVAFSVLALAARQFQKITKEHVSRWGQARLQYDGVRIKQLHQGLGGVKDAKLLGREHNFLHEYRIHTLLSARMNQLQGVLQQMPRLWLELLGVSGLAILVISMLEQGKEMTIMVPTIGLFAAVTFRLMPTASRLINAAHQLRFGLPVVNLLQRELTLPIVETGRQAGSRSSAFSTALQVKNVGYKYSGAAKAALTDVSFEIRKGESIGFIGKSGSGKSTLVDVILGLLPPTEGEVSLDGRNIANQLRDWQDQIGYVPQSIYLMDDTLRRNVAFGLTNEQIDDEAIKKAIKAAQLEDFVKSLPSGLDTIVGERGVRLSGGQRQRIGIARALYHDPAVLVLDEATSSLDTATETGVMQSVSELHGSKTVLIVAHRLSTVENCDRLYRLDQGHLVEVTPSEMSALKLGLAPR